DPRSPHQLHPTRAVFSDLRARRIDTGFYALRGSTHADFTATFTQASRTGQRVAGYLMTAWLDTELGDRAAARRLRARRFGRSADATSIGTGRYDVASGKNVPYEIAGDRVADHLSFYYPSDLYLGGRTCRDLRVRRC